MVGHHRLITPPMTGLEGGLGSVPGPDDPGGRKGALIFR
jgi:hypothetical protein